MPHPLAALTRSLPARRGVAQGYWNYELCFSDSITQFHMTESNQVDWVISLGRYESSDWMLRNTTSAGLFPDGVQVGGGALAEPVYIVCCWWCCCLYLGRDWGWRCC